jgi:hypothetical protein
VLQKTLCPQGESVRVALRPAVFVVHHHASPIHTHAHVHHHQAMRKARRRHTQPRLPRMVDATTQTTEPKPPLPAAPSLATRLWRALRCARQSLLPVLLFVGDALVFCALRVNFSYRLDNVMDDCLRRRR